MSLGVPNGAGMQDMIVLKDHYVLRLQAVEDREGHYTGQVIMVNPQDPGVGTHLFELPGEADLGSMKALALQGLRALYEG